MTHPRHRRSAQLAELAELIDTHVGRDDSSVPGLRLFRTVESSAPTPSVAEASFAFVAQGAKQLSIGEHVIDYGPGDYLIVSVDLPVSGRFVTASVREPFLGVGLTLEPTMIDELAETAPPEPRAPNQPALGAAAAPGELLDALVRLLRLLETPQDQPVLAPLIQREIAWRLLCGPHGELVRSTAPHSSALALIGDAVRWIRAHLNEPFRVEDLAARSAMSTAAFHRHFRAATTMGPIQYQKTLRLQQARLLLLGSAHDVTATAHAVGYRSASQFSREYRREFGVNPSHAHITPPTARATRIDQEKTPPCTA